MTVFGARKYSFLGGYVVLKNACNDGLPIFAGIERYAETCHF